MTGASCRPTIITPWHSKAVNEIDAISFARQAVATGRARQIREAAGYTRETMARELGVASTTVYKWEQPDPPRLTDRNAANYGALLQRLETAHTESQPA